MHRLGCWKERLLYSVPALVCAIYLEFLCLPHCCRFLQYPHPSLKEGRRGYKTIELIVAKEWMNWLVYVCNMCVKGWLWVPHDTYLVCRVFLSLHKLLTTGFWWSGSHGDSIMHMTATRNHTAKLSTTAVLSVQACTKKWPLNVHTWLTFKAIVVFHSLVQKETFGKVTNIGPLCMCSSSISTNQSLQKTCHENSYGKLD